MADALLEHAPWSWPLFAALVGALAAGFAGVAAWRLPRREAGLAALGPEPDPDAVGRVLASTSLWSLSRCEGCGATLGWRAYPLVAWLAGGVCPRCGHRANPAYAALEALSALVFAAVAWRLGPSAGSLFVLLVLALLLAAAWVDWETFLVPDAFVVPALLVGLLASPIAPDHAARVWGMFLPAALLWFGMWVGSWRWGEDAVAGGDVLMIAALGALVGADMAPALLVSSCLVFTLYAYPMRLLGVDRASDAARRRVAGGLGSGAAAMGPAILVGGVACILLGEGMVGLPVREAFGLP